VTSLPLKRTEYFDWNAIPPRPRGGGTSRGESFVDAQSYLTPSGQIAASALHTGGVAEGFAVTATTGQRTLTVRPGVAVDPAGHVVSLAAGGQAIVDPTVDPDDPRNITTVPVPTIDPGVALETDGLSGDLVVTVTWREVLGDSAFELVHAPWLRLLAPTAPGLAQQVVLARATLDATGAVTVLSAEGRRLVGLPAERVELRRPRVQDGRVEQQATGELRARPDGGLELNRLVGGAATPALTVDGVSGDVIVGGGNVVVVDAELAAGRDLLVGGAVGVGLAGDPKRPLHVEGNEVHSGGGAGGFSFADRTTQSFTESPTGGERWVWYARDGQARLWSGSDRLTVSLTGDGNALDVARRMRVRQGGGSSAGIWFQQDVGGDRGFVGMRNNDEIGFFGNTAGVGWTVKTNVTRRETTVEGQFNVNGQSCAQSFCNLSDERLKTDVAALDAPLERLSRLRGVSFRWNPASGADGPGIGVLAQEVEQEFPELVSSMGPDEHLGVDYSGLTAVLLEAVKTLAAQNAELRSRLDALDGARE
jgi:hypothetical protein